jgi:hypothetical protein
MGSSRGGCRVWMYHMLAGFILMNMALFLHPMSPQDFLKLAFSDPLLTIQDAESYGLAVFFWTGIVMMGFGAAGVLERSGFFHKILSKKKFI